MPEYLLALEQGASREAAAPLLSVPAHGLMSILLLGKMELDEHGPFRLETDEFLEAGKGDAGRLYMYTLTAEARCEQTLTRRMYQSSEFSWKAAQTLLERRFPKRWAAIQRTDAQQLRPEGSKPKPADRPGLTSSQAEAYRKKVLGVGGKKGE